MDKRNNSNKHGTDQATDLIRKKISALYSSEPDVKDELKEVESVIHPQSKHQKFMQKLHNSGKSMAEMQAEWHNYYIGLNDKEKHEVWQEFYQNTPEVEQAAPKQAEPEAKEPARQHDDKPSPTTQPTVKSSPTQQPTNKLKSVSVIKKKVLGKVRSRARAERPSHARSLLFGLGMGSLVILFMLFGFFNERIIAPYITPSRTVSSTPIITEPGAKVGSQSKVIIPKINVEVPVVYDETSIDEAAIQKALERGVVHYPTTPDPGQRGNAVIFGHSSNNILNPGKYKFAFVLLSRLETDDTFMLQKDGKRYVYRVYEKKVVSPTDLSVLRSAGRPATATLITCDPPGTTINRLIVIGEQISPDPANNVASTANQQTAAQPETLPSDAPSLWQRFIGWLVG